MRTRLFAITLCLLFASLVAFGQAGTGTITGVVTDQTGAVVAGANVSAKNSETGVTYPASSSNTGNYTLTQLPPGNYELDVKVQGFKDYIHKNLQVQVAGIIREDVGLQVGSTGENVTVTAEASLLKTESGDLAHNITVGDLDNLPILGIGTTNSGSSGVRNPYGLAQLIPGVEYTANSQMIINGTASNTAAYRIEGQDMTNHYVSFAVQEEQPSADAIQEVAVQTSNFAPEFGTAGGAVFNITMKSGTNQYHGSAYEYFVNEDLNAAQAYSIDTAGNKIRPKNRRNDYGGTLGGPVWIPKIYNGHNKTFFFYNWEQYKENAFYSFTDTVPVPDYINGNFGHISPNGDCSLCAAYGVQPTALGFTGGKSTPITDALGRQLFANTIYDPLTRGTTASGLGFANPFPNNVVPTNRMDASTVALEKVLPAAQNANLTNNYPGNIGGSRITTIPSWKFDESLTAKDKLSFYYSTTGTASQIAFPNGNADGLPVEIGAYRGTFIDSKTIRLNYDRTLTPTLLLHLGAGYQRLNFFDDAPFKSFDPASFGLTGFLIHRQFPSVTGISSSTLGGMQNIGTSGQIQSHSYQQKPSYNANATLVRGSHTYKAGAEVYFQGTISNPFAGVTLGTGPGPTMQPFNSAISLNGQGMGFGYASWLLGDYNSTGQTPLEDYHQGKAQWAMFVQDSWKVTRKLTVDYGIRWDLGTAVKEQYNRVAEFDMLAPNANAGGHLGATRYANTCSCSFYPSSYPYAIGPRVGAAYQINNKTVIRAGWGVVYQFTTDAGLPTIGSNANNSPVGVTAFSQQTAFVNIQTPGAILQPVWPVTNPNIYPNVGQIGGFGSTPTFADANLNRPPRQQQFSFGIQREVTRDFVVEASYVGNRVVWLGGPLGFLSQFSQANYQQYGLNPYTNYADFQLLSQPINSAAVMQRMSAAGFGNGGLLLPYTTFVATNSLASVLRPFPQFGAIGPTGSATGNSRYDSLQAKVTKRLSRGLQATGTFTWQKGYTRATPQDFFNPNGSTWGLQNLPLRQLNFNVVYTTQKAEFLNKAKFVNTLWKDWQIGAFAQYQSASFLTPPNSPTSNFLTSQEVRVAGQPLYLKDVNGQLNPYTDQILNPAAWQALGTNAVGPSTSVFYTDFRGRRHPQENLNIGRNFRIKERMNLQIRAEFVNILNRTYLPNPSAGPSGFGPPPPNPQQPLSRNGAGQLTAGFGTINATAPLNSFPAIGGLPRTGTLIARFSF